MVEESLTKVVLQTGWLVVGKQAISPPDFIDVLATIFASGAAQALAESIKPIAARREICFLSVISQPPIAAYRLSVSGDLRYNIRLWDVIINKFMRLNEIDPKANLPTTQYSFPEKPTGPKPPKAPFVAKVPVKPKTKTIKPLPPDKAMVASLRQQIERMREKIKRVQQYNQ